MRVRRSTLARPIGAWAAAVVACGLATLPFTGDRVEQVHTYAPPSAAAVTASPPPAPAPAFELAAGPLVPLDVEPVAVDDVPPPPPPPPPPDADPTAGVVPGEPLPGAFVGVPSPDGGGAAPAADSAVERATPGERVWAVVIGIDDYPGIESDLRFATADARDLVTALLSYGVPADQVLAVLDRDAGIDGVLEAVAWLVANAGPDDTAVFLYAGHVRDLGRGTEAVVTADGGWIADWFLAQRFEDLRARDAWFVLATCYGGGFDELLAPNRVLTAAAGPGQLAYENERYRRSYLAEFVLHRGLVQGAAGEPTVQAAAAYGSARLAESHPDRQIWHADRSDHVISLDGVRRDGSAQPGAPPPAEPPPAEPPSGGLLGDGDCLLGVLGTCREE